MKRLAFESYLIHRGFVQLTMPQWHNLPASYAGRLHVSLIELDKMAAEKQKAEMKKGIRG